MLSSDVSRTDPACLLACKQSALPSWISNTEDYKSDFDAVRPAKPIAVTCALPFLFPLVDRLWPGDSPKSHHDLIKWFIESRTDFSPRCREFISGLLGDSNRGSLGTPELEYGISDLLETLRTCEWSPDHQAKPSHWITVGDSASTQNESNAAS
jgi:hypothetical protein